MSDDARSLIAYQEAIATKRQNLDQWWQDIALRVMPDQAKFTTIDEEGTKRIDRVFSGKPVTDNQRFAAVLDDLLTPRTQQWHALAPDDDEITNSQSAKEYLERLNKALFTMRYRPRANFASQKHRGYMSVGAFGNSCLFIDENVGDGAIYRQLHMREVFWSENDQGTIDQVYRRYCMKAQAAVKAAARFGWELPSDITKAAEKSPMQEFEFLHVVRPNDDRKMGRVDSAGMPWASFYVSLTGQKVLSTGGHTSWPFAIGRYTIGPGESYGRSPAMSAWGSILTLNEQKKTILRAGQKEVDPPILLQEDGVLEAFNLRPGALNFGGVSTDGTPLAVPFKTGANIPLGLELMQIESIDIEDAFLVSIFKILSENPQMTATQVLEIVQQKATLLAPTMGQMHSEDLGPLIEREIDILARDSRFAWINDDMPPELRERGGAYKIEYRSPLARAMRAQDGVAIMRTLEALPAALAVDKNAAYVVDIPESLRELAEINGMPAKLLRGREDVEQIISDQNESEQAAALAAAAPEMSAAALNAAKAEQLRLGA